MSKQESYIIYKVDNKWQYKKFIGNLVDTSEESQKLSGEIVPYEGYAKMECDYRNGRLN
jgi:hypothetical protein